MVNQVNRRSPLKLYWFIPDGVRAEPQLFDIYRWASEGKLPNIKKLMEKGTYGFSYQTFPGHTPTNFATLLTGSYPEVHGIDDGPMHVLEQPLDHVTVPGFRSTAKKVSPIWKTLENAGIKVALISIPGSTPPEIQKGIVIRGRWGGWGADFHALNFEAKVNLDQRILQGRAVRLFFFGPELTQYIDDHEARDWQNSPMSYTQPKEVAMIGWGTPVFAYIYDSTDDSQKNYDRVALSLDKKSTFADIGQGDWTDWQQINLKWKSADNIIDVPSDVKATVIKLNADGFFRIRLLYNNLNQYIAQPEEIAEYLTKTSGPMVDFADNFPAQLIYYPEDKKTFQDEAEMSFDWHKEVISDLVKEYSPNAVIHDIYTPNQMLTSRWWMGYIDPESAKYQDVTSEERDKLWLEIQDMYVKLDEIIGEIIKVSDNNTYIVISSDHGAVPLDTNVNLNNLFAQKGWLKFTINKQTGEPLIDWKNSKVIYLKTAHVYIKPEGLAGNYTRSNGLLYEKLRTEVRKTLENLQDEKGNKPATEVVDWEKAQEFMHLDPERLGDLVIANTPGYGWNEEMSSDLKIFSRPLVSGYKQAILAKDIPGMWTPFIISGPGIKKNNFLGNKPFDQIQQYPTIMEALKIKIPDFVQGKPLDKIFR